MKIKRKIKDEYILPVITYGNDKMGIEQSYDGETCGCTAKRERLILGIIHFVIESERPGFEKKLV